MLNQIRNLFVKPADNSAYIHSSFALLNDYLPSESVLNGELQYATKPRQSFKDNTATLAHGSERLELKAHLRALELDLEQHQGGLEAQRFQKATDLFYKHKVHLSTGLCSKEFFNLLPTDRNALYRDNPGAMLVVSYLDHAGSSDLKHNDNADYWINNYHPAFMSFLRSTFFPGRAPKWEKIKLLEAQGVVVWCDPKGTDINLRFRDFTFTL